MDSGLSVLKDADLSGTLEATLERAQQIDPPDRFRADHQQFLQFLKDALPYVRQHDQSVAGDDLVSVFAAQAEALVRRERLSHQTSHDFCRAVLVPDGPPPPGVPPPPPICGADGPLPGGEYGLALHDIFGRYQSEFGPRVTSFPPVFTQDELFAALLTINPLIETVIKETLEEVKALEPPAELRADHDRLIQYLEENLETASAITRAAEARDLDRIQDDLFPRSGEVLCSAVQDLPPTVRPIVSVVFGEEIPEFCG